MSERDQWTELTERLLPCKHPAKNNPALNCGLCDRCIKRPAVAAELRKRDQRIERLEAALANALAELHHNFGCDEQCVAQRHAED